MNLILNETPFFKKSKKVFDVFAQNTALIFVQYPNLFFLENEIRIC